MPREDRRDLEAERMRRLHDRDRGDFGQADHSNLYGDDPRARSGDRDLDDGRPSDRVLWAVIMARLGDERRLDLRNVEVEVHDGEVTLNGTVRHKADKRRIEDVADIEGVRNVQNNLRVRERNRWTFI